MIKLQVYISTDCWTCEESERIAADVAAQFPDVHVQLVDIHAGEMPECVFAVPTYLINGRIVSLGNPTREALYQKLISVQNRV